MYYVLIAILLLIIVKLFVKEGFSNSNSDIELLDWWPAEEKSIEKDKNMFSKIIKRPANVYSVMGNSEVKDVIVIQYSGESIYRDINLFDINFIPTDKKGQNIVIFPQAYYHMLHNDININELIKPRNLELELNQKTDFCLFSVSNCNCEERNNFYKELLKYKKIDSCGTCMNNTNKCPGNHEDPEYFKFIQKYKFMLCFENKSQPNYFTEKLINAYYGKTIPIYWGCSNVSDYINMNSILYLPQNFTQLEVEQLIEKIKILDNNDFAYNEIYSQPLFKKIPDEFNIEKITEKVQSILNLT
jgi:hypothetical protein